MKLHRLLAALLIVLLGSSCTTAYDAYGRPYQAVDPAAAVVGAAAIGAIAYGLGSSYHDHGYHGSHYSHGYYGYHHSHHHGGRYCY
jgi:hypothetical protein